MSKMSITTVEGAIAYCREFGYTPPEMEAVAVAEAIHRAFLAGQRLSSPISAMGTGYQTSTVSIAMGPMAPAQSNDFGHSVQGFLSGNKLGV